MNPEHETGSSVMAWAQVAIGRPGYLIAFAGLFGGAVMYFAGQPVGSRAIFALIFGLLIALPLVNVAAILLEEVRRRDWVFAGIAVVVLTVLAYRIFAS